MAYITVAQFDTSSPVPPPTARVYLPAQDTGMSGFFDDIGGFFNTAIQGFTTYKMADLQIRQADAQARLAQAKAAADAQAAMLARQQQAKVSGTISALATPLLIGGIALGGWMLLRRKGR